jgi:transcriptional regulator with XRE-family HTH domain
MATDTALAERLNALLDERPGRYNDVAKLVGINRRTLQNWRSRERPLPGPVATLVGLGDALGVSLDYLLGRSSVREVDSSAPARVGEEATAQPPAPATPTTPPCTVCETQDGYIPPGRRRPVRYSGAPFGLPGALCKACYRSQADAAAQARRDEAKRARREARMETIFPVALQTDDPGEIAARAAAVKAAGRARGRPLTEAELNRVLPREASA